MQSCGNEGFVLMPKYLQGSYIPINAEPHSNCEASSQARNDAEETAKNTINNSAHNDAASQKHRYPRCFFIFSV